MAKANNLADAAASSKCLVVDGNNNCFMAGFRNRAFSMEELKLDDGRGVFVTKIKQ